MKSVRLVASPKDEDAYSELHSLKFIFKDDEVFLDVTFRKYIYDLAALIE